MNLASPCMLWVQVLVGGPAGAPHFERIFMWSHRDHNVMASFVEIEMASGPSLHLTPGHYLWAKRAGQSAVLTRAGDIKPGQFIWRNDAASMGLAATEVTGVGHKMLAGLYNPHTPSGSIIVDGVATSTFTDVLPPSLAAHTAVTLPARLLYQLLPSQIMARALNDALLKVVFSHSWAHCMLVQGVSVLAGIAM